MLSIAVLFYGLVHISFCAQTQKLTVNASICDYQRAALARNTQHYIGYLFSRLSPEKILTSHCTYIYEYVK